jgi:hypothetical protein
MMTTGELAAEKLDLMKNLVATGTMKRESALLHLEETNQGLPRNRSR